MRRCAGLGVIIHYISDFFTFPHNDHYPGNVKDHCYYERDLKFGMRAFLQTEEAAQINEHVAAYDSVEELTSYIRSIHNYYIIFNLYIALQGILYCYGTYPKGYRPNR